MSRNHPNLPRSDYDATDLRSQYHQTTRKRVASMTTQVSNDESINENSVLQPNYTYEEAEEEQEMTTTRLLSQMNKHAHNLSSEQSTAETTPCNRLGNACSFTGEELEEGSKRRKFEINDVVSRDAFLMNLPHKSLSQPNGSSHHAADLTMKAHAGNQFRQSSAILSHSSNDLTRSANVALSTTASSGSPNLAANINPKIPKTEEDLKRQSKDRHNEVEKRRRQKITNLQDQLKVLVPQDEPEAKRNKGTILCNTVRYIVTCQDIISEQNKALQILLESQSQLRSNIQPLDTSNPVAQKLVKSLVTDGQFKQAKKILEVGGAQMAGTNEYQYRNQQSIEQIRVSARSTPSVLHHHSALSKASSINHHPGRSFSASSYMQDPPNKNLRDHIEQREAQAAMYTNVTEESLTAANFDLYQSAIGHGGKPTNIYALEGSSGGVVNSQTLKDVMRSSNGSLNQLNAAQMHSVVGLASGAENLSAAASSSLGANGADTSAVYYAGRPGSSASSIVINNGLGSYHGSSGRFHSAETANIVTSQQEECVGMISSANLGQNPSLGLHYKIEAGNEHEAKIIRKRN